jgi:hypothetical protein
MMNCKLFGVILILVTIWSCAASKPRYIPISQVDAAKVEGILGWWHFEERLATLMAPDTTSGFGLFLSGPPDSLIGVLHFWDQYRGCDKSRYFSFTRSSGDSILLHRYDPLSDWEADILGIRGGACSDLEIHIRYGPYTESGRWLFVGCLKRLLKEPHCN